MENEGPFRSRAAIIKSSQIKNEIVVVVVFVVVFVVVVVVEVVVVLLSSSSTAVVVVGFLHTVMYAPFGCVFLASWRTLAASDDAKDVGDLGRKRGNGPKTPPFSGSRMV